MIVPDVTEDIQQHTSSDKDLRILGKRVKQFKKMLIETFYEHCVCGLYTVKYHLLNHMAEATQTFQALSVSDNSPYDHFNVHESGIKKLPKQDGKH